MTDGTKATNGRLKWTFTPTGREFLSDDDLDLQVHLAAGRATVIKHGSHRTVYRITLPKGIVYWKLCSIHGVRSWLRDFYRGFKAKLEFDRAQSLTARGIDTVEPLAWGQFSGALPPGSYVITRAIEHAVPLDLHVFFRPPVTLAERRTLTTALAEFVAKLHAAGVTHPDLHPGNLLVRADGNDLRFFLIDIHNVRLGEPLDRHARLQNLVLLNRWFQMRVMRHDRLRFWRAYAGADASADEARQIESDTAESISRLWDSRNGRCLRSNRHFQKVRGDQTSGFAVRDLDKEVIQQFMSDPDGMFAKANGPFLKDSRSATVCRLSIPTITGNRPLVFKRFRLTHWSDPFTQLLRRSPAIRSWANGHALVDRGLPTPRPLLVLHRRRHGLPAEGYLLCDEVQSAHNLHEFLQAASQRQRRELAAALGRWIGRMHDRGVSQRDMKAANILVGGDTVCQFIDLVGVRTRGGSVRRAIRVRDLSRLSASFVTSPYVSNADRLRFLRAYLVWGLRGSAGWKDWWTWVAQRTQAKIARNIRRNRPLA